MKADDTVPHFTTVEEIADSNTDRFLIGGTKKISGLQLLDRSDPQLKHEQRHFLPGDILTREKIYFGETKKRTRLFRKPKYITEKFLMCRDECDREILLPFEQTGIFYQVSHKCGKPNRQVMQMSDIVARKLTPRIIKLVFGRFPLTPCSFTGIMKAESSKIEASIIASTLINTKNMLMEIPVSSAMPFRVAVMNNDLRTNACYRNAMSICAERAISYMRNIKMCYNLTMNDEEDTYVSRKESDIDPQMPSNTYINSNNNNNTIQTLTTFGDKNLISTNLDSKTDILIKNIRTVDKLEGRRGVSVDILDDITIRPRRCISTGRVSFCLGNSYLTVPMYENGHVTKRDSGNNNTIHEKTFTTKDGSRLSFNGTSFEEVEEESQNLDKEEKADIPPPIPCTNISSYVNIISPPENKSDMENMDYIPASGARRPSTQPPDTAPPPLPRSSSTSGVSSGSLSSVSDETVSKRESSDSFEYAVPKTQDPTKTVTAMSETPTVSDDHKRQDNQLVRRPSTFTFSEGCFDPPRMRPKVPKCQSISDIEETTSDDGCPIYENIQKLMELVSKMDNDEKSDTDGYLLDDDQDIPTENDNSDGDCLNKTEINDYGQNENECCELKENCFKDIDSLPEETGNNESDESVMDSNFDLCESYGNPSEDGCDMTENHHVQIDKEKVRRIGVTERDTDMHKLGQYCDSEIPQSEKNENKDSELENSYNKITDNMENIEDFGENVEESHINSVLPGISNEPHFVHDEEKTANRESEKEDKSESPCCWRSAVEKIKNSNELLISKGKIRALEKPVCCLSVVEIAEELANIGIKEGTIEHIKEMGVDGARLSEVVDGDLSIRVCLDGVNLVDQQKISMFLRGWRPNNE